MSTTISPHLSRILPPVRRRSKFNSMDASYNVVSSSPKISTVNIRIRSSDLVDKYNYLNDEEVSTADADLSLGVFPGRLKTAKDQNTTAGFSAPTIRTVRCKKSKP